MSRPTVWRWRERFLEEGVDGLLHDATRPPGEKPIPEEKSPPPERARHWTVRAPAKRLGMAVSTMDGILKDNGLRPHQVKTFKVSRDPRFEIKVRDVVGLHVDPPDHAVVISVDESERVNAFGSSERRTRSRRPGGRRGPCR